MEFSSKASISNNQPTYTILCTECLIDQGLVIERFLELLVFHTRLNLFLNHFKRPIDIVQVCFLVKQRAKVFNLDAQKQFFAEAIKLVLHEVVNGFEVSLAGLLGDIRVQAFDNNL